MAKKPLARYIVRKYVMASSAIEAIKLSDNCPVADVWIDEQWKSQQEIPVSNLGFTSKK